MSEDQNPTADLDSAQAEMAWRDAAERHDWVALSNLQRHDDDKPGVPEGVPTKVTENARDVR
jgi:hypothetical protein